MRWVLICLVAANALYFIWEGVVKPEDTEGMQPIVLDVIPLDDSRVKRLRLLSEMALSNEKPAEVEKNGER